MRLARHEAGHRPAPGLPRKEERIRAHVILCWLALLLARIAESACGTSWPELRRQLDRIQVGAFAGAAGTFRQRNEISQAQQDILARLGIDQPSKIYQLTPATMRSRDGVEHFFDGLDLVPPGVVSINSWPTPVGVTGRTLSYGGVVRKP